MGQLAVIETPKSETWTLKNDDAPSVRFEGTVIGFVNHDDYVTRNGYTGSDNYDTTLTIYRTVGGKYVCERELISPWSKVDPEQLNGRVHKDVRQVMVCTTEAEVFAFFGHSDLAHKLYQEAGLEDVVEID